MNISPLRNTSDVADPRHIGRVEAIHWPACRATVRWLETDTLSQVPMTDLEKTGVAADETPATFAELFDLARRGKKGYWSKTTGRYIEVNMATTEEQEREFWEERLSFFEDWPLESLPPHVAAKVAEARKRYGKD
jgi:hypothetical protein